MVPYSQVPEYISAMDACLIPFQRGAISENALPLKLFEYMACNKPVISAKLPGVENAAGTNAMYADNADEYRSHIQALHNSENLRREMGRSGRQLVESSHDWAGIVGQLEKVLVKASLE
jgi:glycosyltransferase involved in cell wall biosynthesis